MRGSLKRIVNNEEGFVLAVAVLVLVIITILGVAATRTSDTEIRISANERDLVNDFYIVEASLLDSAESSGTWMTTPFLTASEDNAAYTGNVDYNSDGTNDATVEIRCVKNNSTPVSGLSNAANDAPVGKHIVPPPAGSGYSMKYFEVRRYCITTTSQQENTRIQAGAWKAFNKL